MAATEKFDMIPVREKKDFDPQAWDGSEVSLPGKCENGGYFLKEGQGEKVVSAGKVVRGLARREETAGRFSIYEVQASSHGSSTAGEKLQFEKTHHALYTVDGVFKIHIDGNEVLASAGETTFVPAGTKWSFVAESLYAKAYIFANGGGVGEVLSRSGEKFEGLGIPGDVKQEGVDGKVKALEGELGFKVV